MTLWLDRSTARFQHLLFATVLLLVAIGAPAGAVAATLSGQVTDISGAGLPGVSITAIDEDGSYRETTATHLDGSYSLELPAGTYTIVAETAGLIAARIEQIVLDATSSRALPIEIHELQFKERVVVTGGTTNDEISADELTFWQAEDLSDVFRTVPSVSVGGSLGVAQKIFVRDLEDTLLNVSVDGAQQTGTLFHHIGRVSIEPELLEQVEVQAGAGEATSGFGAIGGAIRFRTKTAADLLAPGQEVGVLLKGGYFSNETYKGSLSAFGRLNDSWSFLGSYVYTDRENIEDGNGDEIRGTAGEQSLAFLKLTGALSDRQLLTVSYERRDEEGEFGQRPNWPVLEGDRLFPGAADRDTVVANYLLDLNSFVSFEATAYSTQSHFEQDRFDRWGLYGADIDTFGLDLRNTTEVGRHELIYGVEYRNDEVVSEYLSDPSVWADWAWDPSIGRFVEEGTLFGVYYQDHFQVSEPFLLSYGVRYDAYDLDQVTYGASTDSSGVSGNVGFLWQVSDHVSLSGGVAQALRGKEVGDGFTLEHRPGSPSIDPDIEAEQVTNSELGLVFDNGRWFASASFFQMVFDDVILDQIGRGPPPQDGSYYENVGELESDGVELVFGFRNSSLRADLFFRTYDSELNGVPVEGYEHNGLANVSGDTWNLKLAYSPVANLHLGWNVTWVDDLNDIEVLHRAVELGWIDALQTVDKPGYTVHDLSAEWLPRGLDALAVNLTVTNLFDELYRDHASVADYNAIPGWQGVAGLFEEGRNVRLSLRLRY
ncbi:MAG: TonB-dependent receptor [Thermoanaerobaculia bacterium]|nr:TonB-dependent receptor [Thermoanaerobaculia bacterium]